MPPTRLLDADRDRFALIQAKLASCSKVVGEDFFPVVVKALAEALSVRWVLLSTLVPDDRTKVSTVAVWDNGPAENFVYELDGTPCANIVDQGACGYPDHVADLFPNDAMLKGMGAQSYVGTPLHSSAGQTLGLIAALDEKPIESIDQAVEILELFSGRIAAELERLATSSLNERLGRIVEDSVSEVYLFDGDDYTFQLVNRGARENLGYSMAELRELTPWDLKPEFSPDEFKRYVEPLRRGEVPHLLFETVHERKDGTTYDVAVQLQFFSGVDNLFYASINDITERKRAEEAQAKLAAIVASSNEAIISKSLDGTIHSWNRGAERLFGFSACEMIGKSIRALIPFELQEEEDVILARISRGEVISNYETTRLSRTGERIEVSVSVSPIFNSVNQVIGASKIAHDITARKRAEARERLLMREVNHRSKNLLTLVQVIARQTAASDPGSYLKRFEERLIALSASHDLLVNNLWENIPLDALARSQLGHFKDALDSRISLDGPALEMTAGAAQSLGMAFHELATNAAKYGALSNSEGRIDIAWAVSDENSGGPTFTLRWSESGGPEVTPPKRSGFGSTVIDRLLESRLRGTVEMQWRPSGLVCEISCPAESLVSDSGALPQPGGSNALPELKQALPRILVVEDEFLIGVEIARILDDCGMIAVGPAASVAQALDFIERHGCDAAILDINLGDETSEAIAGDLLRRGIPFLSVSGCRKEDRPSTFNERPHLNKPIEAGVLIDQIRDLL